MSSMQRRDFLKTFLGGAALSASPEAWPLAASARAGFAPQVKFAPPAQSAAPHFNDLAEYKEAKYPLLAGDFAQALKFLVPRIHDRPGPIAYAIATIFMLQERYARGIPYSLQACRAAPETLHYRWMLRALTLMAGRPESTIPAAYRLKVPEAVHAPFHLRDVTAASGTGRVALGRGAAWGDFDGDGRDDILVGAERAPFRLLHNLGNGQFTDVAAQMGLVDPVGLGCYAAQFVDYDNDGFQDIFLSSNGWGGGGRLFLFHNERGKKFTDVTQTAGLGEPVNAFGSAWADYDNDGHADLAVATGIIDPAGGDRIRLFHNEGNGEFREVGLEAGLAQKAQWISVCWGDYDGDGRQDLVATSYNDGCFLFRNLGNGRFEEVTGRAGLRESVHAYTAEFFDYDNDGRLDLFVSTYPDGGLHDMIENRLTGAVVPAAKRQLLFHNDGSGKFSNVTVPAGITGWFGAMSSQVADLDNDGYPEIVLGTGNPELDWTEPKALFLNNGRGHFTDVAQAAGLVNFGMMHGMAFSDYDDSGNLSLFGSCGGFYWGTRQSSRLYHNEGSGNRALELRLVGTRSNRDAIGAHVTAYVGSRKIHRWVNGGNGFGSLNSRVVHIGLGRSASVDRLLVAWPSGLRQSFRDLPAGHRLEIREGSSAVRSLLRF
jgi:hypothetical protein